MTELFKIEMSDKNEIYLSAKDSSEATVLAASLANAKAKAGSTAYVVCVSAVKKEEGE